MAFRTAVRAKNVREDEEAFLWATAALGEARANNRTRARKVLEALVEDLAFGLGAHSFPPNSDRALHRNRARGRG